MEIYAGNQADIPLVISNKCTDVVCRMVSSIINTGQNINVGNWFRDAPLMSELKIKKSIPCYYIKEN